VSGLKTVDVGAHWASLFGVPAIGFALTIVLLGLILGMAAS
jgi:hypothetical protein